MRVRVKDCHKCGQPTAKIDKAKVKALADEGMSHADIAETLGCSRPSVYRILG